MAYPKQGDRVTAPGWNGEFFLVTRVGVVDGRPTIWISDNDGEWPYPATLDYRLAA